jgi:hypothetical protein
MPSSEYLDFPLILLGDASFRIEVNLCGLPPTILVLSKVLAVLSNWCPGL